MFCVSHPGPSCINLPSCRYKRFGWSNRMFGSDIMAESVVSVVIAANDGVTSDSTACEVSNDLKT